MHPALYIVVYLSFGMLVILERAAHMHGLLLSLVLNRGEGNPDSPNRWNPHRSDNYDLFFQQAIGGHTPKFLWPLGVVQSDSVALRLFTPDLEAFLEWEKSPRRDQIRLCMEK